MRIATSQDSGFGPKEENLTPRRRTPASSFEGLAEETGIRKAILHDGSETVEAKVNEIIVLGNDLSTRAREVQGI